MAIVVKVEDSAAEIDLAREAAFALGPIEVRPPSRELVVDGRSQSLEPRVMQVLVTLARRRGEVVSRGELVARCWGGRAVSEDAINRSIHQVRRLADIHGGFSVVTVARIGYRLDTSPRPAASAPTQLTLAVLAFDNLSADPEMAYFCDGVSEEIRHTVAQGSILRVVARSSSFQFRGVDKAVGKVGPALGATHLLDGSVRRSGAHVRISAELLECAGGSTIWASRFDGDLGDVFALQERIAAAVAHALKTTLTPSQGPTLEPHLYELFLRARGLLADGDPTFDDSALAAAPLLEQVVAESQDHAPAWELLANARASSLRSRQATGEFELGRRAVVEAAENALRLDAKRGGAYVALAAMEPWGAYLAREKLLGQALAAAPRDPAVLTEMSDFLWAVGRFRAALRLAEQACELNPLMPEARRQVAMMLTYVGDYDASIRMLQELHERWPANAGILLTLLGNAATLGYWDAYDGAVGAIDRFEGWQGGDLRSTRRYAEALRSGDPAMRAERLRRYTALLDTTGTVPLNLIEGISQMGMVDEALSLAERSSYAHIFEPAGAAPSGYFPGAWMGRWSPLIRTPRFIGLCDRLGLCAYWAQTGAWPDCADWVPYDFKAEVRRRTGAGARA